MKPSDFLPMEIHISDSELDEELNSLLDDPNGAKKSKSKGKKAKKSSNPPPQQQKNPKPPNNDHSSLDIPDDIDVDDVSLNSDDLAALDDEFKDLKSDEEAKSSAKIKYSKNISDDEEDKPKQKIKPKKNAYQKELPQQTKLEYDDVFDYFSGNFYNFLNSVDEPKIAQQYMAQMENLAPIIFAGEDKFDNKGLKIEFLSLPKKIVPFGHWSNIRSKELKVDPPIAENKNVRTILNDQLNELQKMKAVANSRREDASGKEIDRAIKLTNQSLKAAFPKPEFLVSDYIQLQHSAQNTALADKEVQVTFNSVRNCNCKDKYQIQVDIIGLGKFQSRKLSGANNDNLNDSYTQTYDPKKLQNAVTKGGRITIGDKTTQFSLSELVQKSTTELTSNISGTIVSFSVSIRTPLNGDKTIYELKEFFCCPTVLTEALSYTPRKERVVDHSPKSKLANPAPNPAPHLVILSKEERNLFWGTKATECLKDSCMIKYFQKNKYHIPQEYVDQINFFTEKMKEFEKMQEDQSLDPYKYLDDLKAALKREKDKLPTFTPNDLNFRKLLINSIQEEVNEIEKMLQEEDE